MRALAIQWDVMGEALGKQALEGAERRIWAVAASAPRSGKETAEKA